MAVGWCILWHALLIFAIVRTHASQQKHETTGGHLLKSRASATNKPTPVYLAGIPVYGLAGKDRAGKDRRAATTFIVKTASGEDARSVCAHVLRAHGTQCTHTYTHLEPVFAGFALACTTAVLENVFQVFSGAKLIAFAGMRSAHAYALAKIALPRLFSFRRVRGECASPPAKRSFPLIHETQTRAHALEPILWASRVLTTLAPCVPWHLACTGLPSVPLACVHH